jgi:hypothetical protein
MNKALLYSILAILLIVGLAGCRPANETQPPLLVTLPPDVLTRPPTPVIQPTVAGGPASNEANESSNPLTNPQPTPTLSAGAEAGPSSATSLPTPIVSPTGVTTNEPPPASNSHGRYTVGAGPGVPPELIAAAQQLAADQPLLFSWTDEQEADAMLGLGPGEPLATWVYSVAAPFATVSDARGRPTGRG